MNETHAARGSVLMPCSASSAVSFRNVNGPDLTRCRNQSALAPDKVRFLWPFILPDLKLPLSRRRMRLTVAGETLASAAICLPVWRCRRNASTESSSAPRRRQFDAFGRQVYRVEFSKPALKPGMICAESAAQVQQFKLRRSTKCR
ncbi:hypothetical protein CQ13_37515 [Bradyrhizobium retamae]|uniref:Uncharacterized protein n=1 Tax=Bradyrhizobium retamae TaxID=1300035 RepID=A0A0R3M3Z8_9BRAD|nr:hypothetical protein CQ13_37515 [Bradyrhizobium retamae]